MIEMYKSDLYNAHKHLEIAEDALTKLASNDDNARASVAKITVSWAMDILESYMMGFVK